MIISQASKIIIVAFVALAGITGVALAHDGATGIVKERMDSMKDISAQMKLMKKMIQKKQPYDAERFKFAATTITKHGNKTSGLFPKDSTDKPSRAKPAIWQDWDTLTAMAQKLTEKSIELADKVEDTKNTKTLRAAFQKLAKTCKSCHKKFRNKK